MKFPKTPGACVDKLYSIEVELDKAKAELQKTKEFKKVSKLTDDYKILEEHMVDTFPKQDLNGAKGKLAIFSIDKKIIPKVDDWDKFYEHVRKTKSFDLLQKRISTTAVKLRWDDSKTIPGVGKFNKITTSLKKLK